MPVSTRGRKRETQKAVPISAALYYGFLTVDLASVGGVSEADIVALGQIDPASAGSGSNVVFGMNSPTAARFRKKLSGTTQDSVSSFGDGSTAAAISKARNGKWNLAKPIRRCTLGTGKRNQWVAVTMESGLLVACQVPKGEVTGEYSGLFGWKATLTSAELKVLTRGSDIKAARVKKSNEAGVTLTYPCSHDKLADALAQGWADAD